MRIYISALLAVATSTFSVVADESQYNVAPLVLDLDGRGFVLSSPEKGVQFDGEKTAWVNRTGNAFLVFDKNRNGKVDGSQELFSNETIGPNKATSANGFLALAKYDENHDGKIDPNDSIFSQLMVWRETKRDGKSTDSELSTLAYEQIDSISLRYGMSEATDKHGNRLIELAQVRFEDGSLRTIINVWFRSENKNAKTAYSSATENSKSLASFK